MRQFTIEVSVRDAQRANTLINDNRGIREMLDQTSTNTWELKQVEEDCDPSLSEEYMEERVEEMLNEVKDLLDSASIEYVVND